MSKYILPLIILLLLNNIASAGSRDIIRRESTARRLFSFTPASNNIKLSIDQPNYALGCAALLLPQEYFANRTEHEEMVKWASDPEFNANMKFYAAWKRAALALPEDRRPDEATLKAWVKEIWDEGRTDIRQWEGDEFVDYINTYATARAVGGAAAGAGRADADAATEGSDEAESAGTGEDELTVLATPGLRTPVPAVVTPPSPTPEEIAAIAVRDAAEAAEAAERTRQFELRLAEEARALQAQREAEAREAAIRALEEEQRAAAAQAQKEREEAAAAIRIQAAGRGYKAKQLVKGLRREQTLAAAARAEEERLAEAARIEAARALEAQQAVARRVEEERLAAENQEKATAAIKLQAAVRRHQAKNLAAGLRRERDAAEEERLAERARIEVARALQAQREAEAREAAIRALEEQRIAEAVAAETRSMVEAREAAEAKQRLRELLADTKARIGALTARRDAAEAAERAEAVKHWLQMKAALEGVTLTPKQISDMGEASKATKDPLTQFYVVANSSLSELLANPADLFARTSVGALGITYPAGTTPTVAQAQQVYARREQIIQSLWEKFRLNPEAAPNILRNSYFQNFITRAMFAWDRAPSEIYSLVISLPWDTLFDRDIFNAELSTTNTKGSGKAVAGAGTKGETSDEIWDPMACLRAVRLMDLLSRISGLSMDQISAIVAAGAQAHGRSAIEIEAIFNARALRDIIADPFGIFVPAPLDKKDKTTLKTAPLVRDTLEALERAERVMDWVRSHAAHRLIAPETMGAIEQAALQARGWTGAELATLLAQHDRDSAFFVQFVAKLYGSMLAPRDEGSSMDGAGEARSIKDIEKDTKEDESKGGAGGAAGGAGAETEKLVVTAIPVRDPREAADLAIALAESLDSARADHAEIDAVARAAEILSASGATSASPAPPAAMPAPTGPTLAGQHVNPDAALAAAIAASLAPSPQPATPPVAMAATAVAAVAPAGVEEEDDPRAPEGFVGQAVGVMARVVNALTGGIFAAAPAPAGPPTEEVLVSAAGLGGSPAGGRILPNLDATERPGDTNA